MLVTLAAAVIFVAVELAFLVGYLQRRGHQAPSAIAGRSNPVLEVTWAILPVVLLALLVLLTLQAAEGASPQPATVYAQQGGNEP